MRIYWTLKSIPELAELPPDQRRRRWREAYLEAFHYWPMWAATVAVALGAGLGSYLGSLAGWQLAGGVVGAAVGSFPASVVMTEMVRHHLRVTSSHGVGDRSDR